MSISLTSNIEIRPHIQSLQVSPTLAINELSQTLLNQGRKVYRLGFGQSPFPIPDSVVTALQKGAAEKDYLPVLGLPALRAAVAHHTQASIGVTCSSDQVMIGPGSKELLMGLQMVCEGTLLLPAPSWVSYAPQAFIAQGKVDSLPTTPDSNWMLEAKELANYCTKNPNGAKILLLNYPNNPVGATFTPDQLAEIVQVAQRFGVLIVSDEIYGMLHFEDGHQSIASLYPKGTIVSSGLSKWCGAGGWRLGTFVFPKEMSHIKDAMAKVASESFSAVSAPIQFGAIPAFEGSEEIEWYLSRSRLILKAISRYVVHQLRGMRVTLPDVQGGFYAFPNFDHYAGALQNAGISNVNVFCSRLLEDTGIALLPGTAFGLPTQLFVCRLSFVDFDGTAALESVLTQDQLSDSWVVQMAPKIVEAMKKLEAWLKQFS